MMTYAHLKKVSEYKDQNMTATTKMHMLVEITTYIIIPYLKNPDVTDLHVLISI